MKLLAFLIALVYPFFSNSQNIYKSFEPLRIAEKTDNILVDYSFKKEIPEQFRDQIATALLYYPELKDIKISFRIYGASAPLIAQPTFLSAIFRSARNRHYIIGISDDKEMDPVLLANLPLDAQIGVLGHELSHISEFIKRNRLGLLSIAFANISRRHMDRIETSADQSTIDHGLGWQLLIWAEHVRMAYAEHVVGLENVGNITEVKDYNPNERYMFPETIMKILQIHPLYSHKHPSLIGSE